MRRELYAALSTFYRQLKIKTFFRRTEKTLIRMGGFTGSFAGFVMLRHSRIIIMSHVHARHQKTCLRGLRPGKTQTGLLSYRDQLES